MTVTIDQKVIDKVQKLLSLAGNNPSKEEAESALLKAQEYLAKHGLSMADVEVKPEEKEVFWHHVTDYKRLSWYERYLSTIIGKHFRCKSASRGGSGKYCLLFCGLKEDVEVATEVFRFALDSLRYCTKVFGAEKNREGYDRKSVNLLKNSFINGFLDGLDKKLTQQTEQNGWSLVLVVDALVVQEFERTATGKAKPIKFNSRDDGTAYSTGYERGISLDTSCPSLIQ